MITKFIKSHLDEDESVYSFKTPFDEAKKPVIMQVIPNLNVGGAEQAAIDMTAAITQAGGRAIVVSNGGKRVHEIARNGGVHVQMPVHSKNIFTMLSNAKKLRHIIETQGVSVVHARSRAPAWSCYWACKKTAAHFMTSFHAAYKFSSALKKKYNAIMVKGECVIAISNFIADHIQHNYNVPVERIKTIHRGSALDRFHPNAVSAERMIQLTKEWGLPEDKPIILMPARQTRIKGHKYLIDALAKLGHKNFHCVMVGSIGDKGYYREELEKLIAKHDLTDVVHIHDYCNDMPAAYRMATVVVAPSIVPEGFGRVPVEAQAMGRLIIATNIGATCETIIDGETGWLVPPRDARALYDALDYALNLPERKRVAMGTKGMNFVSQNFSTEKMCQSTLDVYSTLINQ